MIDDADIRAAIDRIATALERIATAHDRVADALHTTRSLGGEASVATILDRIDDRVIAVSDEIGDL
jgi:hypothetical protein